MTINFGGTSLAALTSGNVNAATREASTTAAELGPYVTEGMALFGDDNGEYFDVAASATKWLAFHFYTNTATGTRSIARFMSDDTALFELYHSGATIALRYWNGSTWTTVGTTAIVTSTLYRFDFRATMDNASGVLAWYKDAVAEQTFSGDTILTAATTINKVHIRNGSTGASDKSIFSGLIIADEDTRDMIADNGKPTGAGTNSAWTGAYTAVDETGVDDTDFISTTAAANTSTFAFTDIDATFASGYDVVGLCVVARAARGPSGVGFVKPAVYSGATLGTGTSKELDVTFDRAFHIFTQDPNTAAAWAYAGVNAAEIGVQSSAS